MAANQSPAGAPAKSEPIPMDQIGAVAGKQYHGDGLAVAATPEGARLRCVFQKLEGQATPEGLWLTSTTESSKGERFRVVTSAVGREVLECGSPLPLWNELAASESGRGLPHSTTLSRWCPHLSVSGAGVLATEGTVEVSDQLVRYIRPGLTEEYSVSMDGVRQDFIIERPPLNSGPSTLNQRHDQLRVELDVTGAKAEPLANGARLVLDGSGRKIAYSRLRATDATGRELKARIEVASGILPDVEAGILPPGMTVRMVRRVSGKPDRSPPGWEARLCGRQGCLPLPAWVQFSGPAVPCSQRWWMPPAIATSAAALPPWVKLLPMECRAVDFGPMPSRSIAFDKTRERKSGSWKSHSHRWV